MHLVFQIQMMLAKAYLNSEQYELCEQVCTYMSRTFPNDNTVQIVSVNFLNELFVVKINLDDGKLSLTKE